MRWIVLIILILQSIETVAQYSNEKCAWVKSFDEPIELDSLSVISGSLRLPDSIVFTQNISTGQFTFSTQKHSRPDSIEICYKTYPFTFHAVYSNRDIAIYDSTRTLRDVVVDDHWINQNELFSSQNLNKTGSISRGVSFGNTQDVFVNSTLNLNMDGQLADNLFIRAAITDQNVPYQPEGNTQQLQDFDNVFIELYNDNFSLTGGDIVLQNKSSNFLRYYKNVQGGLANIKTNLGTTEGDSYVGFSIAKGKFASVQIAPEEGLAGPYRIPGPNDERFLLIMANSEKVFLDGQRLERGFDRDYIIDYNSGELTFTNEVLITQFSRVRVDYEYSDQFYSRAITVAGHEHRAGNYMFSVHAYQEKDNPNNPILAELTTEDKSLLSGIGNDFDRAVRLSVDSIGYTPDQVLYRAVIVGGEVIYQYSTNPDSAHYRVTFSDVGEGNGNYNQVNSTANGRVFEYVAPIHGVNQGRYIPYARLVAPNMKSMLTVRNQYKLNDHEEIYSEVAFSRADQNLYSKIDDDQNNGYAIKSGLRSAGRRLGSHRYSVFFDHEYDSRQFNGIDRFRSIEFDRDWNYNSLQDSLSRSDRIINAGIALALKNSSHYSYNISFRNRDAVVNGVQHNAVGLQRFGKLRLKGSWFLMNNDQVEKQANWLRYYGDMAWLGGKIVPGYQYRVDHNTVTEVETDSVSYSAMYFEEHTGYMISGDSATIDYDIRHTIRKDFQPREGLMEDFLESSTSRVKLLKSWNNQSVSTIFNYRTLTYVENDSNEETVSGRVDHSATWLKNLIKTDMTYSIANSRELQREYSYINVPAGQGTHTWRDLNEDGVQELSEFFEAINPDERNYAKIFTPGSNFIEAYQNLLLLRLNASTPRSWRKARGLKKIMSKLSTNTNWSSEVKTTDDDLQSRTLSFAQNVTDSDLLTEKSVLRSTVFFNRAHSVYGLDITYSDATSRQLLLGGFDYRRVEEIQYNGRLNLAGQYNLQMNVTQFEKEVGSEVILDRNYLITGYGVSPKFSWQPSNQFRMSLQYGLKDKVNELNQENPEHAQFTEWMGELTYSKAIHSNFNAQLRYVNIDYSGLGNGQIAYDMLEALQPGRNMVWQINWQQKLIKGLQMNISYNGRKSEDRATVHMGRVQVSALF